MGLLSKKKKQPEKEKPNKNKNKNNHPHNHRFNRNSISISNSNFNSNSRSSSRRASEDRIRGSRYSGLYNRSSLSISEDQSIQSGPSILNMATLNGAVPYSDQHHSNGTNPQQTSPRSKQHNGADNSIAVNSALAKNRATTDGSRVPATVSAIAPSTPNITAGQVPEPNGDIQAFTGINDSMYSTQPINQDPAIAVTLMREHTNGSNPASFGIGRTSTLNQQSQLVQPPGGILAAQGQGQGQGQGQVPLQSQSSHTSASRTGHSTASSFHDSPTTEQPSTKSESGGIISSFLAAAANKMMTPVGEESKDKDKDKKKEHSLTAKLDNFIKSVRHDDQSRSSVGDLSDNPQTANEGTAEGTEAGQQQQQQQQQQNLAVGSNDLLSENSAHNVQFEPVRESPLNTLGSGELSLADFEQQNAQAAQMQAAQMPIQGQLPSRQASLRSGDTRGLSIKRNFSPDVINKNLPHGNQLQAVSNGADIKRVHRRSLNGSTSVERSVDRNASVGKNSQFSTATTTTTANGNHDDSRLQETKSKTDETIRSNSDSEPDDLDHIIDYTKKITHASRKSNKEFHEAFKKVPKKEKLIQDFSCALSKDILVQGKMYLSDHYICFSSNILGFITHLMIPLQEVIQIEKKSTAVLFPNGMIIRTLHQKYVFATFMSRDAAFELITNVWHRVLLKNSDIDPSKLSRAARLRSATKSSLGSQDSGELTDSGESSDDEYSGGSDEDDDNSSVNGGSEDKGNRNGNNDDHDGDNDDDDDDDDEEEKGDGRGDGDDGDKDNGDGDKNGGGGEKWKGFAIVGPATHEPTETGYSKESNETFIAEDVIKAPPGVVFNILFGPDVSYFVRTLKDQKNFDIDESAMHGLSKSEKNRHYTYIKPLSGPIGPKQTKCIIDDTVIEFNPEKYYEVEQATQTPDVPSGNSFKIKTKIFLSWAEKNSTKIYVVTSIEWSGKSWIKGAIEKGTIDGQKDSMKEMIETINSILAEGANKKGGSSKRRSTKSKRQSGDGEKSEGGKQSSQPSSSSSSSPQQPQGVLDQLMGLINSIGDMVPIPMLSSTIVGSIILVVAFFISMMFFNKVGSALFGSGSNKPVIEIIPSNAYTSRIKLNNDDYLIIPTVNTNFANERKIREEEVNIWNWLESRSGGEFGKHYKLRGQASEDESNDSASNQLFDRNLDKISDKELREKYSGQELKELLKVTQLELEKLSKRINQLEE
ncbi:hypothetical protein PVL30_000817 [Lodderomyces elongisporus]|uniref:uncharacterized protein n=1 Tax=Lodderomyces elongisporus TaxID=36914 RepID=UPI0029251DEE|nr:uncharacterized protein PVL30_000817 [Lodderomyces elongisporus]WLF77108.1 hypothetical protein PVL30_000817 [Lodderomyces elongisporus]